MTEYEWNGGIAMKNKLKRLSVALLSFVMVVALAVPALAVPSDDYAVLNIRYRPNKTPVNGVEYRLYKVADAKDQGDGTYTYTLTAPFAASGIDVDAILKGGQLTTGDTRNLLVAFGTYINEHQDEVRGSESMKSALTARQGSEDGIARFTGVDDGLYLATSSATYTEDGTTYTPVPFLLKIPYVMDGVENNYLTANVKFTTSTPGGTEPDNPRPGGGGGGGGTPTPPPTVDVEEPEVPLAEPDVPLVELPEEIEPEVEIPEEDPPLAMLPQTGLLWWPVPLMAAAGAAFVLYGAVTRRKSC